MNTLSTLTCAAALTLSFNFAAAQSADYPLPDLTNEQIESEYLACERLAATETLGIGTATHCSIVYEAFKARAFDGDFERLLAWWRQQQMVAAGADAP
jgi:hypothetical protein